jgi:DNA-binding NarL/FixJ family response regulator
VTPTRILIADDHSDIRQGFRLILDAQPDMTVVAEAADGAAAIEQALLLRPDVVIADIRMPRTDGLEVTRRLAGTESMRVIVLTTFDHDNYAIDALANGACGFVLKRSGPMLLVEAVRAAMAGDTLIAPQLTVRLLKTLPAPTRSDLPSDTPDLTRREKQIVRSVAQGSTNAEIAAELFISAGTVKTHIANIQNKLSARNRVGIASWAWQTGHA